MPGLFEMHTHQRAADGESLGGPVSEHVCAGLELNFRSLRPDGSPGVVSPKLRAGIEGTITEATCETVL